MIKRISEMVFVSIVLTFLLLTIAGMLFAMWTMVSAWVAGLNDVLGAGWWMTPAEIVGGAFIAVFAIVFFTRSYWLDEPEEGAKHGEQS